LIHDEIGEILKRWVVRTGAAPGASAAVAAYGDGRWRRALGVAGTHSRDDLRPVTTDTIYDLASLTKPMLAALLARRVSSGELEWDTPLGTLLAAARGTASEEAPVALLASHRAGLMAHLRLGAGREGPPADAAAWLARCANARRPECRGAYPDGGHPPLYSDLGYILLGQMLSEVSACPIDALLDREVALPLSLSVGSARSWQQRLGEAFLARVAPTEVVAARGGELRGVVHDDNAWELAGKGAAGHAGLFGTARGVLDFCTAMLDALSGRRSDWLTSERAGELTAPRVGGSLRMGFDGKASEGSSAGPRFGPLAFGHLGFTGTSLWCEPEAGIAVVLLTNRVSPSSENILIRSVRPDAHGALFGLAAGLCEVAE
jgi:CubicO group peptidase (beta-lactamase class C family)